MPDVSLFERIASGRTDLVFDYLAAGNAATDADAQGVSLLQHSAYYGDVSAIRYLLTKGESLTALEGDLGLNAAIFHGHWRLARSSSLEQGADANYEPIQSQARRPYTPRSAPRNASRTIVSCTCCLPMARIRTAPPNPISRPAASCVTSAPAANRRCTAPRAFGDAEAIQMLLDAGAKIDAKDAHGDSPLELGKLASAPRTPSCACSCMETSASTRSAPACASTCRAILTRFEVHRSYGAFSGFL